MASMATFMAAQLDSDELKHRLRMNNPERTLSRARDFLGHTWNRDGWEGLSTGPAIGVLSRARSAVRSAARLEAKRRLKFEGRKGVANGV